MIKHKLVALLLAFIGVAAMVFAWFILLTTASYDLKIVALESMRGGPHHHRIFPVAI